MNEKIVCAHGVILKQSRAKRKITEKAWKCISDSFPNSRASSVSQTKCEECEEERKQFQSEKREIMKVRSVESRNLPDLYSFTRELTRNPLLPPRSHTRVIEGFTQKGSMYLVPIFWLLRWVEYVNDFSINDPGPIPTSSMICSHGGTMVNMTVEDDYNTEFHVLWEKEYKILEEYHGIDGPKVMLERDFADDQPKKKGFSKEILFSFLSFFFFFFEFSFPPPPFLFSCFSCSQQP